jgi:hypothetical protein
VGGNFLLEKRRQNLPQNKRLEKVRQKWENPWEEVKLKPAAAAFPGYNAMSVAMFHLVIHSDPSKL